MQIDYTGIGSQIRAERTKQKISQERLAELVGVGTTHISHIETGNTIPSMKTFIAIVNALNLSADELLRNHIDKSEHIFTGEIAEILKDCTIFHSPPAIYLHFLFGVFFHFIIGADTRFHREICNSKPSDVLRNRGAIPMKL